VCHLELILFLNCTAVLPLILLLTFQLSANLISHHTSSEKWTVFMSECYCTAFLLLIKITVGSLRNYRLIGRNAHLSSYLHFSTVRAKRPDSNCHYSNSFTNVKKSAKKTVTETLCLTMQKEYHIKICEHCHSSGTCTLYIFITSTTIQELVKVQWT
jgi:hypothetical protein